MTAARRTKVVVDALFCLLTLAREQLCFLESSLLATDSNQRSVDILVPRGSQQSH